VNRPRDQHGRGADAGVRRFVTRLSRPPRTPDLASAILDRVARERPFVAARGRRRVRLMRGVPALLVLLVLGAIVALQRTAPGRLAPQERSLVSAVVHAGQAEVARGAAGFGDALDRAAHRWVTDLTRRAGSATASAAKRERLETPMLVLAPARPLRDRAAPLAALGGSGGLDVTRTPPGSPALAGPTGLAVGTDMGPAPTWLWGLRAGYAMAGLPRRSPTPAPTGPEASDDEPR